MLKSLRFSVPLAAGFAGVTGTNARSFSQARISHRPIPLNLKNQVVLITGATAGIGASCAWQFAEEGCNLILVGRRDDRLQIMKKEIMENYPSVDIHTVAMSVTDLEKVAELPNKLPPKFKNVDILVNNAGLALGVTAVEDNDVESAKTVLDTNVLGMIALCRAFLPGMKERGNGHLINMGSIAVRKNIVEAVVNILTIFCTSILLYCRDTMRTLVAPHTMLLSMQYVDLLKQHVMILQGHLFV